MFSSSSLLYFLWGLQLFPPKVIIISVKEFLWFGSHLPCFHCLRNKLLTCSRVGQSADQNATISFNTAPHDCSIYIFMESRLFEVYDILHVPLSVPFNKDWKTTKNRQ